MSAVAMMLIAGAAVFAQNTAEDPLPNVNSRYTVESVEFTAARTPRLSRDLSGRLQSLVGARFDPQAFDEVVRRIRTELRNAQVSFKVERGSQPEHVRVVLEVSFPDRRSFDLSVPEMLYHSKQNFSFGVDAAVHRGDDSVVVGALTDNDRLLERRSGVHAGYERSGLWGNRLRLGAEVASWRSQWAAPTEQAAESMGVSAPTLYRSRLEFLPSATFTISRPLTLQLGVGVERLESPTPAVGPELSNAANLTLRFQQRWRLGSDNSQSVDASYQLRTATHALGSDYVYTRHLWQARYVISAGRSEVISTVEGGVLLGRAPWFDRFILGNSQSLRGWNRFDLAAAGGDRMARASVDYRYRWLRMIYESGAVWNRSAPINTEAKLRQSAAIGICTGSAGNLSLLVAFPLRAGGIDPIFMAGINF
jgi:outer membrane protein assembly factor BamA